MRYYFILFAFFSFFFCSVLAQNNYRGIVINAVNDQPVSGVTINVANKPVAISDTSGLFQFSDSSSKVVISFSAVEYLSQTNNYKAGTFITAALSPSSTYLMPAIVTAFERNTTLKNIPV